MTKISFKAPEGFAAPEDAEPGEPFDVLASVVLSPDGMVSLTAVDGLEIPNPETEEEGTPSDAAMEEEMRVSPASDAGFVESVESRFQPPM
jgi:hypothetical protein